MSEAASFLFDRSIFTVNLLIICVLFLIPLEKRRRFPLRLAAGAALCIALSLLFPHTNLKYIVELAAAGAEAVGVAGYDYPVTASLAEDCWFPTKTYTDFALPAGQYTALRVEIGAGAGQNWWCVVFPPLCTAAACDWQDAGRDAGLAEDDLSLMAEEDQGYQLRFRSVELWEKLRQWLGK